jgi:ribosomal protein L11 methyltransferase
VGRSWLQLSIRTSAPDIENFSNFVIERGSPGVVLKRGGLEAFFLKSRNNAALRREVQRFVYLSARRSGRPRTARLQWKTILDEDWEHSWKRFIKPARIGKNFWVTPPWLKPPKFRRRKIITIEPGMAFGTGTHATTRGCMELLEMVAAKLAAKKWSVLDVGTGSGILSIAARISGATRICAIDNDPVAVKVARDNLRLNGVANQVVLSEKPLGAIKRTFTVVVANLTAETILEAADELEKKVAFGGYMVLSGILRPKVGAVTRRFAENFCVLECRGKREWVTLLFGRTK